MKIGSIIAADIAIAAIAVILWSPIVGLSPTDPNILRAAAAITSYIAIPAALIAVNRPLLALGTPKEPKLLDVGVRGNELGKGDELLHALESQSKLPYVGEYAGQAARQVDAARRKRKQVIDMLSTGKLTPGSLAWQRFATGIDEAETTVRNNGALISSACTSFDGADYAQLRESISSGKYRSDNINDELQLQRLSVYQQTIARIKGVLDNNERILFELDSFASEVSMQAMTPSDASSERMLQEMRTLIDEARQYA